MRVVFFLQGQRVPAARMRGMQIARELERRGVECSLRIPYPSVYGDSGRARFWSRIRSVFVPFVAIIRLWQMRRLRKDDVIVFQRPMIELPTVALERMLARRHRTIFDFDDAIFLNWRGRQKLAAIGGMVDHIIAGNRFIAEEVGFSQKTTVIPTAVDTSRWTLRPTRDVVGKDVVLGWTGTVGNYRHIEVARDAIARVLRRTGARLLVIADAPPPSALAGLKPEFVRWREDSEIEDLAKIDVGVMPLPDRPRERGKCAFKLIQYMAIGRPGVASPVGANCDVVTHGQDGFLPRNQQEWEDALMQLVQDAQLRRQMGEAARARVESAYSLDAVIPRYLAVLDGLRR
jgi:glycosyltransferase involved in cell wall biosynthesis